MSLPNPRRGISGERLVRRLDRAAAQVNPILAIVIVGLVILNLIALGTLVPHVPITRMRCAATDSLAATQAGESKPIIIPKRQ